MVLERALERAAGIVRATPRRIDARELDCARSVSREVGKGLEKRLLRLDEPALLDESDSLPKRGGLGGRLSQDTQEKEDQDSSSEKTAFAMA